MSSTTKRVAWKWAPVVVLLTAALSLGRSSDLSASPALTVHFAAGESLRYEFEGIVHIASAPGKNVKLNVPEDYSYHLRAVLKFDFDQAGASGTISGRVHFQSVRYEGPACAAPPHSDPASALRKLESSEIRFDIKPAGDASLHNLPAGGEQEGVSLLLKAAWDVLQAHLSDKAVSPGPGWIPSRRFLYWPDTFVEEMEVAAASMQYPSDVTVAARPYAWLQYKQVFSPADMPAYVETRSQARDFTGITFVSGAGNVSLLFDRAAGRVVYLRRTRNIDDRTLLKYDDTSVPLGTISLDEESSLRWLPEQNSEAWLAELHKFESEPARGGRSVPAVNVEGESPLAAAARRARARTEATEHRELSELIDQAPHGFERWQTNYCNNGYCFDLSIVVPEQTRVVERRDGSVLLLSGPGDRTVTIAVGPVLDLQHEGLDADELLKQQTHRFVGNYLWFASGSGRELNFERTSVHDRAAAFSDFTATARDLKPILGRLVMVVAPYGRLAPVSCSFSAAQQGALDATCQTVTGSIIIR
jgi:hypothetical protein